MGKRTWTNEEINILYENFPEGGIYKCIELLPNKKRTQIKAKIDALKIKSVHYNKWSDEENKTLKNAWENFSMKELLETFPNRTYQEIQLHANTLGYHSKCNRKRKCDLSFLKLDNLTYKSAYWWGFIMADGHLSKNGQLIIQIKKIDRSHLEKFSNYVSGNVKEIKDNFVRLSCSDIGLINEWKNNFEMKESAKTYFPPNLSVFEEFFIYFFIGFVDGDGCIWINKNYPQLKIELHSSWLNTLEWFSKCLEKYEINSEVKLSKKNTATLIISTRNDILKITKYCKEVDYLERKWEKILLYKPTQKRKRSKTYDEYIQNLKEIGVHSLKDAYKTNRHPERGAKKYNVSLKQIDKDLQKTEKLDF